MVALFSPLLFPNMGWSIDDYISHEQFGTDLYSNAAADTSPHAPPPQQHFLSVSLPSSPLPPAMERCDSLKFDGGSTDIGSGGGGGGEAAAGMVKKLSHNASERDRRKKMNGLFSSLRSLLPPSDQKARMSIPTTVSRVVKYIPELQKEVERLQKKKQELTSRVNSWQKFSASPPEFNKRRRVVGGHPHHHRQSYLSASQVGERDIVIQICSKKGTKNLFADALSCLEQEGLVLLDSSTFQTSEDRVNFYTLHLQVQGIEVMEVDKLKEKLLSYFNEEQQNFYHDTN